MAEWISDEEWEIIVRNVPIVSVDLVVLHDDGVVLGKRKNEPAKGEWFVPGGRVRKHERLRDAVHRIGKEELGVDVEIIEFLGTYEHFYDTADVAPSEGKHYLANGFVVRTTGEELAPDSQHETVRTFHTPPEGLHRYVEQYLEDASAYREV